jgi:mannosyltransferase OCH1-like enzyme
MPDSVTTLINQWKYLNPTWTINVLSNDTLSLYIKSSELPDGFYDGKESPQYSSDIVRIILLYKYGGVWVDSSIMLLKSLDWVLEEFNKTDIHYLGYYMPSFTTIKDKPIIESWFIASKPNTNFLKLVYKEMKGAFGKRQEYVNRVRKTVDLQNIPETLKVYLTIHVAMQVILQRTKNINMSQFKLVNAYKDAFALHGRFHWSAKDIVSHIKTKEFTENKSGYNIIKLRNDERRCFFS